MGARLARMAALALLALPGLGRAGAVAVTFDDLPLAGAFPDAAEGARTTAALLAGFRRNRWPVTGFVNEIQLVGADGPARTRLLEDWLSAGEDLGNHSYSHLSLDHVPLDAFEADVARGGAVTGGLLAARGRRERWFRFPYLETGLTPAVRDGFEAWLAAHGYRNAPVSMENADWQFADAYDQALAAGDPARAAAVRDAYLAFTAAAVAWYREAATELLGREPAFVMLMHASRLNAASVDALAAILRANRLRPVPLARAMRDPAYRIPDEYAGPNGDEWLSRWALTLHRSLPFARFPHVPAAILDTSARVEAAGDPAPAPPPAAPAAVPPAATPPKG